MEQIYKRTVSSGQTNKLEDYQQNALLIAMLFTLLVALLLNFQPMLSVY